MKIAYVTTYDSADVHQWAGLGSHITHCLERQGVELIRVGSFENYSDSLLFLKRVYYKLTRGGGFRTDRDTRVLQALGRAVASRLANLEFDAVFSPGTLPIAYLDIDQPIVFWTDATFDGLVDFYPDLCNLCPESIRSGHQAEQAALTRCHAAIYSSQWAADTAAQLFEVAPSKIHVVPFGANLDLERSETDIEKILRQKPSPCRLIFIGVDWERKGGSLAVALAESLNRRGIVTELQIVGCSPPGPLPDFVKVLGFISKATAEGRQRVNELFAEAHFLVLPSRIDCAPVVVAESGSFGLPAVTSDIAGLPSLVRSGTNGWAFPLASYVDQATDIIARLMENPSDYRQVGLASFREYQTRLNWDTAGQRVHQILSDLLASSRSKSSGPST